MPRLSVLLFTALLLTGSPGLARELPAAERLSFCFNYGCLSEADALFDGRVLRRVQERLAGAADAGEERSALADAVAMLYRAAGHQTPIHADRAGNLLDAAVDGRMDCIDHSTNTTRLLKLLERRGWLRFHRVTEPARRTRVLFQHFSAVIEELEWPQGARPMLELALADDEADAALFALCDCGLAEDGLSRGDGGPEEATPEVVAQYVVDSWFVEHGERPVVLPLQGWLRGEGPNVQ